MSMAERIKECRVKAGLSQSELADKLVVSRQAVSKWESGKGTPDIMNLKNMANLFDVSVDYLLDDESSAPAGEAIFRQPVDVESLEPLGPRFAKRRANAAVRLVFPVQTVWPLIRTKKNNKSEELLEWVTGQFGAFNLADSLHNRDSYYLVEDKARHLLVRVSKEAVEARELTTPITGATFTVGMDKFRRGSKPAPW